MSVITYAVDSHVALITLDSPETGNRLNPASLTELESGLKLAADDFDVRAVVLRARGETFCLGMDLFALEAANLEAGASGAGGVPPSNAPSVATPDEADADSAVPEPSDSPVRDAVDRYGRILFQIFTMPKPVVALVDGDVKAGGAGLVAACDIVLATERTSFELSEVFFGLIPANVLPYVLGLRLPLQKARYLVLTAKHIDASEAHRLHLIDELHAPSALEKGARSVIKNLLRASPTAMAEAKAFTLQLSEMERQEAQQAAMYKLLEIVGKREVQTAVEAFNEGRTPEWFEKFSPESPLVEGLRND
jgi:enoyl-CoA hydratase/carnithine racemase